MTSRVLWLAAATMLTACGAGSTSSAEPATAPTASLTGSTLIPDGAVVAVLADRTVPVLDAEGTVVGQLGTLPADVGEVTHVSVAPDRRTVLVSVVDDHDETCRPQVLLAQPGGSFTQVLDGSGAVFNPDGSRVAYWRYAVVDGFCRQTELALRDVATGEQTTWRPPAGPQLRGNPPQWPMSWSPDGAQLALAHDRTVLILDTQRLTHTSVTATPAPDTTGVTAPVFTGESTVAVMDTCCVPVMTMQDVDLATGVRTDLFAVPAPVRSIGRDGSGGLWLTVEEVGLLHWDGSGPAQPVATPGERALVVSS